MINWKTPRDSLPILFETYILKINFINCKTNALAHIIREFNINTLNLFIIKYYACMKPKMHFLY